jgi:ribose transport system substrate-binding protein
MLPPHYSRGIVRVFIVAALSATFWLAGCSVAPVTEGPDTQKVTEAPVTEVVQATEVSALTEESQVTETLEAKTEKEGTESESTATAYEPVIRPAKARYKIGYGNGMASDPFSIAVTKNTYEVAQQMGVDIVECDNGYDQEKTLNCTDLLISQNPDGLIVANWLGDIAPVVGQKWIDAGIPAVTYDTAHPGAVDFGADNYTAGFVGGEYLGKYVLQQGWEPTDVWMLLVYDSDLGKGEGSPNQRVDGCRDGVSSVINLQEAQFSELNGKYDTAAVYTTVTDWLTAHPDAKYVLGCSIDDPRAAGISGALEADGRVETSAVMGLGAGAEALAELYRPKEETPFVGSVAFTPELYGTYLVPIIVDLIEGNPVPNRVILKHFVIDHENVNEYYPQE